jgi:signal transduction histidine kinase
MSRLLRKFSIGSFLSVVIAAALLTLLYRQLAMQQTVQLSERSNVELARSLLTSVQPELDEYLASVQALGTVEKAAHGLSTRVVDFFKAVMRQTSVVRVKLYDDRGIVVFSTDPLQIGDNQANNAGIVTAGQGRVATNLAYGGGVNGFDGYREPDHLFETYVPVRASPDGPVRGVFEIYTQATPLISQNERSLVVTLLGVGLILLCHYAFLILAVRRAKNLVQLQQDTINERTQALEKLSADMLNTEEMEKQKLANGLHEDLAQTLSAIKVCIEQGLGQTPAGNSTLARAVPALQDAIAQVRNIAMDLRPPSLDDLGLFPTIDWFCQDVELRHSPFVVDREFTLRERDVPGRLKIVIYRIIESALKVIIERHPDTDRIRLALRLTEQTVILTIDDIPNASPEAAADKGDADRDAITQFATVRERAVLSGGEFSIARNEAGGNTLRAAWRCS